MYFSDTISVHYGRMWQISTAVSQNDRCYLTLICFFFYAINGQYVAAYQNGQRTESFTGFVSLCASHCQCHCHYRIRNPCEQK